MEEAGEEHEGRLVGHADGEHGLGQGLLQLGRGVGHDERGRSGRLQGRRFTTIYLLLSGICLPG